MTMKFETNPDLVELEVLTKLLPEGVEQTKVFADTALYKDKDSRYYIEVLRSEHGVLFVIDLRVCFNKTSQSPICFPAALSRPPSRRKLRRVKSALNYLWANRKVAGTFLGELPGYDDLGQHNRNEFYTKTT